MPLSFGNKLNNIQISQIPTVKSVGIGAKEVSKTGSLNFNEQTNIIPSKDITKKTTGPDPSLVSQLRIGTNNNPTGTLGFDRNNLPSQQLANTPTPNRIGFNESGIVGEFNQAAQTTEDIRQLSPLANIAPAYGLNPIIEVQKSTEQILKEVTQKCTERILDELDKIDPSLRLQQLLDRAQQLCALARFTELRQIIDRIQQAKRDIIAQALKTLTDPLQRIAKLTDMLIDAINTGAQELVEELLNLIKIEQFNDLINALNKLDPRKAIQYINDEIKRLTDLRNFSAISQVLNALNVIQSDFQKVESLVGGIFDDINALLDEPERLVNEIQRKIRKALDLNNYDEIRNILAAYDGLKDNITKLISELDPQTALRKLLTLANEALKKLDLGRYNRILNQLADRLCNEQFGILPELPNVPPVSQSSLPEIIT